MKRIEELAYNTVINYISTIENEQQKETAIKMAYDFYKFGIFSCVTKTQLLRYIDKRF